MGKSLDDYGKKRDFGRSPEPAGAGPRERGSAPVFVVHRHDARRLHYDLRLEMEGVLRSWAVPKGFSYDPKDKHLAVRTEDHPLEYEDFSGVIPKGSYGAGTMSIWDRGTYALALGDDAPTESAKGELKLLLYGRKLRGEWHLVRTRTEEGHWLLFKSKDRYAGVDRQSAAGIDLEDASAVRMPRTVKAMRAGATAAPFSDPEWLFEVRLAGQRILVAKTGDRISLRGLRRRRPELEQELRAIGAENALLDGVLVALDEQGRPCARALAEALAPGASGTLYLYLFDLLYFDEFDLRGLRLVERKGALRTLLPAGTHVQFVDHVLGNGEDLAEATRAAGLPALIAKRIDAPYRPGASENWVEVPLGVSDQTRSLPLARALEGGASEKRAPTSKRLRLTNLEKVYWPTEGFTKGDLIAYYREVSELLLPYLADRPIHMNRYPDGIGGKSFYQKQVRETDPDWLETVPIQNSRNEEPVPYPICNDLETLLYLANSGSIDLHPWLSRKDTLESPDWAVIDLDPKEAPFAHVIRIARVVGELLEEIGLRPLLKTSGATGLHIHVPLQPGYTYDHTRMFCEGVARAVASELRDIATVERVVGSREGKVYIDYLQNRRGQTLVPPYVPRPVPGATVSTPLLWDELTDDLHPSLFTIRTALPRFEKHGDLFAAALDDPQDLMPAIEALARRTRRG